MQRRSAPAAAAPAPAAAAAAEVPRPSDDTPGSVQGPSIELEKRSHQVGHERRFGSDIGQPWHLDNPW